MARRAIFPAVTPVGDAALLVRFGDAISPRLHRRVMTLLASLDAMRLPGLRDLTPAYASLLVQFDPLSISHAEVSAAIAGALAEGPTRQRRPSRLVQVPVCYGNEGGPDLADVARLTGLTADQVIERHAGATYRVYFLGFQAGFPYLGILPRELAVPRLERPRPHVGAGSVGVAERQTGVYPAASPGGWRIIGRTSARLFDPAADPPSLLRPGDRVRFVPMTTSYPADAPGAVAEASDRCHCSAEQPSGSVPLLRVLRAGPLTTIQDLGRWGYARYGISAGGAADDEALRLGNRLLGNDEGAPALEITLGNCAFEALAPCAVALTGADCRPRLGGQPVATGRVLELAPGQTLDLGLAERGARAYLCMAGGVLAPLVLGSRSTDLRAGLGGLDGRALRAGDTIWGCGNPRKATSAPMRAVRVDVEPAGERALRVHPGPQAASHPGALDALLAQRYVVDPLSDRMGVRLRRAEGDGPAASPGAEILSASVVRGAVQVPPGGEPIVLMADAQTTGGYAVPAVVVSADLGRLAQLRPGDRVRFELVSLDDALAALRERRRRLDAALAGGVRSAPADELLGRGFAEWSEAADPRP